MDDLVQKEFLNPQQDDLAQAREQSEPGSNKEQFGWILVFH